METSETIVIDDSQKYLCNCLPVVATHSGLVVVRVGPVAVELDDVGVLEAREVVEYELDLILLRLEVLALGKLYLVPHHLDALLGVHGEVRAVDTRYVTLLHLQPQQTYMH